VITRPVYYQISRILVLVPVLDVTVELLFMLLRSSRSPSSRFLAGFVPCYIHILCILHHVFSTVMDDVWNLSVIRGCAVSSLVISGVLRFPVYSLSHGSCYTITFLAGPITRPAHCLLCCFPPILLPPNTPALYFLMLLHLF